MLKKQNTHTHARARTHTHTHTHLIEKNLTLERASVSW